MFEDEMEMYYEEAEALKERDDPHYINVLFPDVLDDLKEKIINFDKMDPKDVKKYLYDLHNQLSFYGYYGQAIENDHTEMFGLIAENSPVQYSYVPEFTEEERQERIKDFYINYHYGTVKTINKRMYDETEVNFKNFLKCIEGTREMASLNNLVNNPLRKYRLLKDYMK